MLTENPLNKLFTVPPDRLCAIDASRYQVDVGGAPTMSNAYKFDWKKARSVGVSKAYIKAVEGVYSNPNWDVFPILYDAAAEEGIEGSPYAFYLDTQDPRAQAKKFKEIVGRRYAWNQVADIEDHYRIGLSAWNIYAFLEESDDLFGLKTAFYTNLRYWREIIEGKGIKRADLLKGGRPLIIAGYPYKLFPYNPNPLEVTAAKTPLDYGYLPPEAGNKWDGWQVTDKAPGAYFGALSPTIDVNWIPLNTRLQMGTGAPPVLTTPPPEPIDLTPAYPFFPEFPLAQIVTPGLRIRSAPDSSFWNIRGSLPAGEVVEVLGIEDPDSKGVTYLKIGYKQYTALKEKKGTETIEHSRFI